jgi:hypothetical protein
MLIAALLTIAKLWNQPRCPSTYEWIKKMYYTYTMEYYLSIKNVVMLFAGKWMELDIILPSSQKEILHEKYCMFSLICII